MMDTLSGESGVSGLTTSNSSSSLKSISRGIAFHLYVMMKNSPSAFMFRRAVLSFISSSANSGAPKFVLNDTMYIAFVIQEIMYINVNTASIK